MINITIDNKPVQIPEGTTILQAAEKLGIKIPTLCCLKDILPITSCMLCIVKVEGKRNMLPSCATKAEEGMVVINDDPSVAAARRTALELLLSDHAGDCMGPCQVACPAGMDIPQMIRYMSEGDSSGAVKVIKEHIALPAVTGYICPAPCEKACRRGHVDESIAVRLIKRCAAELDLAESLPYKPDVSPAQDKKVAVVGAGPAGLSAAYYLAQEGVSCTVFDKNEKPGGMLRYGVPEDDLPRSVLDAEIEQIKKLGVEFKQGVCIGTDIPLEELKSGFDAVFIGTGKASPDDSLKFSINSGTMETDIPGAFAGGDVRKGLKLTVRSLADGKKAAVSILQFLNGEKVTGSISPFNTRMGKLEPEEFKQFPAAVKKEERNKPSDFSDGIDKNQAVYESAFCLHCDCRKADLCRLRIYAQEYGAKPTRYKGSHRAFRYIDEHPEIVYEPGKCINCGICVHLTEQKKEKLGLTFIGRGFDVRVDVPLNRSIAEGLSKTVDEIVNACPTGALAFKGK